MLESRKVTVNVLKFCIPKLLTWLIEFGFNGMSTLAGHFVLSPREREKRDRRGDERDREERWTGMKVADKMAYANSADPDQTAPEGAVWSGSTLFAIPKVFKEHKKQNLGQNGME